MRFMCSVNGKFMCSVNGKSECVRDDGRDAWCRWGYICLVKWKIKYLVVKTGLSRRTDVN